MTLTVDLPDDLGVRLTAASKALGVSPAELMLEILDVSLGSMDEARAQEITATLDERMEEYRRNPELGRPWAEVKARLRAARGE